MCPLAGSTPETGVTFILSPGCSQTQTGGTFSWLDNENDKRTELRGIANSTIAGTPPLMGSSTLGCLRKWCASARSERPTFPIHINGCMNALITSLITSDAFSTAVALNLHWPKRTENSPKLMHGTAFPVHEPNPNSVSDACQNDQILGHKVV
jgi:hypothetical protein